MRSSTRPASAVVTLLTLVLLMLIAPEVAGQTNTSSIAGVVKDTSGAVLPGVTVEASSPALIERARSAITDSQGQYKIVDLSVGTYSVTFNLTGFSTLKREGVQLPANFTATVNAELSVGSVSEAITVSGQSPVVDTRTVAARNVVSRDVLDTVPSGKTLPAFVALTPGMTVPPTGQDVGGSKGETFFTASIHGSKEFLTVFDGFDTTGGAAGGRIFVPNPGSTQETSVELGGGSAEFEVGGIRVNFIPKDGGNVFSGDVVGSYSNHSFQGTNLTPDLQARGLSQSNINTVKRLYDFNGSLGGPLSPDRSWFFTSHRYWGNSGTIAGDFYAADPRSFVYSPDPDRPALNDFVNRHNNLRVTTQLSPKNKLSISYDHQYRCDCHRGVDGAGSSGGGLPSSGNVAPEATQVRVYLPNDVLNVSWSRPASNKLLLEGAGSMQIYDWKNHLQPGVTPDLTAMQEQSLNLSYRAPLGLSENYSVNFHYRFSTSYVTGSHAFKAGVDFGNQWIKLTSTTNGTDQVTFTVNRGVPTSLTERLTPIVAYGREKADLGLYAQDQWTIRNLTLNLGLRFDYLNAFVPAQHVGAVEFAAARDYSEQDCLPCWRDLSPRLSAAYDLFGNGKTALKVSLNRYVQYSTGIENTYNPVNATAINVTRAWHDDNHDFVPDCDLTNPASNGECAAVNDSSFGKGIVTTHAAPGVTSGFGVRPVNWQFSTSMQHELVPGIGVSLGYFRTSWRNFTVTDNLTVAPQDFDPYCVTLPADSRLPGGGGNQLCGLYDLNPSKFGQPANNFVTPSSRFGSQTEVYNGLDVTVNARLPRGARLGGGVNTGRNETSNCFAVDTPQQLLFCDVRPPFLTQVKFNGTYPLPWDLQLSGVFQSLPGIPISASYVAAAAQIVPSLGRGLSGNAANVTIANIIQPQTTFEGRLDQLDLRLTRSFKIRHGRLQVNLDLYNVLNGSAILAETTRYGPAWLTPTQILDARLVKFSGKLSF